MSLVTRAQREIAFPRDVLSSLPRSGSVRVLKHAREILIAILSCISYVFSLADLPPSLSLSLSFSPSPCLSPERIPEDERTKDRR